MLNQTAALDRAFGALADPTRRFIVERLEAGPSSITELAAPLPMSLPAVLQHVGVLERSGLVVTEKVGRIRTCRLDVESLDHAQAWLAARRRRWERRLDRLGSEVAPVVAPTSTPTHASQEETA
jgi:DNA-binding transcriptional ArsR family regulator